MLNEGFACSKLGEITGVFLYAQELPPTEPVKFEGKNTY